MPLTLSPDLIFTLLCMESGVCTNVLTGIKKTNDGTLPNFIKEKSTHPEGATVNQHPPAHPQGWMLSGQETVFCWVPAH
jgi:hypothetical protein